MWKLFIDDERDPVTDGWVTARTSNSAINACVERWSLPNEIAFDHDLGGEDTTRKFVLWMFDVLEKGIYRLPKDFKYSIHSQNPIGARSIRLYMEDIIREYGNE